VYRFYPKKKQEVKLNRTLELCCRMHNAVDPRGTTQKFVTCDSEVRKSVSVRVHRCSNCTSTTHRDLNTSLVIKKAVPASSGEFISAEMRPLPHA